MALMEISVVPLGTESPGVGKFVAECIKELKKMGVKFQLTPMGTVVEGDLDTLLKVITRLHKVPFKMGALRVVTSVKIDDRRDKELSIEGKVKSVNDKLEGF